MENGKWEYPMDYDGKLANAIEGAMYDLTAVDDAWYGLCIDGKTDVLHQIMTYVQENYTRNSKDESS